MSMKIKTFLFKKHSLTVALHYTVAFFFPHFFLCCWQVCNLLRSFSIYVLVLYFQWKPWANQWLILRRKPRMYLDNIFFCARHGNSRPKQKAVYVRLRKSRQILYELSVSDTDSRGKNWMIHWLCSTQEIKKHDGINKASDTGCPLGKLHFFQRSGVSVIIYVERHKRGTSENLGAPPSFCMFFLAGFFPRSCRRHCWINVFPSPSPCGRT